ncbi:MAG: ABC transporter ATP-binding protein, partial [Acetobacteraceae bacterium]|nr:ABC transporter ATP-binding protein [Acetobacteraceae bacterium]
MAIGVEAVEKRYVGRGRETVALARIDLDIPSGEFVAFVGPSGCGKSTLLNMIAGILAPTAGRIVHDGRTVEGINTGVGYMTQADSVLPWRTVAGNIELPLRFRGLAAAERRARSASMISQVGLSGFENAYPVELSGGMRKRVALAQLLVYEPTTLLMDEPFGALDAQLKLLMQKQLLQIWEAGRQTVVFVTHDLAEAVTVASRVIVFSGRPGRIKAIESIDIAYPRDPFRVRFLPAFEAAYARLWDAL